jgi:hypothetical protein
VTGVQTCALPISDRCCHAACFASFSGKGLASELDVTELLLE